MTKSKKLDIFHALWIIDFICLDHLDKTKKFGAISFNHNKICSKQISSHKNGEINSVR